MLAFLLSRQSRRLTPRTWWIRAVDAACAWGSARFQTLLSFNGFSRADFPPWTWHRHGGAVVEASSLEHLAAADAFIAVDVRRHGNMLRIGLDALARGRPVYVMMPSHDQAPHEGALSRASPGMRDGHEILLEAGAELLELNVPLSPEPSPDARRPGCHPSALDGSGSRANVFECRRSGPRDPPGSFLWHCTRAATGAWPGQSIGEYYASLLGNHPQAEHTACDALDRILGEGRLRARGDLIRGAYPVVCFTAKSPEALRAMRAYKPALMRWDFEPFAVGIRREAAIAAGIKPVRYLSPVAFASMLDGDRHLFQKHDPPAVDYSQEEEWRSLGDVWLDRFLPGDVVVWRGESLSREERRRRGKTACRFMAVGQGAVESGQGKECGQ